MSGVLVDTSVWRRYFAGDRAFLHLGVLLDEEEVLLHPWVLGELILGRLGGGEQSLLDHLPGAAVVDAPSVFAFIRRRGLTRRGLGWVDVSLLASALATSARLWTADRELSVAASSVRAEFRPPSSSR